jgi:hypothetical protein
MGARAGSGSTTRASRHRPVTSAVTPTSTAASPCRAPGVASRVGTPAFDRAEPLSLVDWSAQVAGQFASASDGSGAIAQTHPLAHLAHDTSFVGLSAASTRSGWGLVLWRASLQRVPRAGIPRLFPQGSCRSVKGSVLGDGVLPLPRLRGLPSLCRMCGNARHGPFWTKATATRCSSGVFEPPPLSLGADGSIVTRPAAERARRIPARASIWSCGFSQWEARRKRHRAAHFVRGF